MKTVAVRLTRHEVDELREAYAQFLGKIDTYRQRGSGLDLIGLWFKLEDAALESGSVFTYDSDLPKWMRQKLREALRTASQVNELKAQVETLEARAKARGVTTAPQLPAVTKARKKPARQSRPKKELPIELQQPAPVS